MVPPTSSGVRAGRQGCVHSGVGVGNEAGRGVGIGRFHDVHQSVRIARQHIGRRLGGADVQAPIDHGGIDADDVDVRLIRNAQPPLASLPDAVGPISVTTVRRRSPHH